MNDSDTLFIFSFFCNLQLRQEKKDLSNLELTEKETNILE